jgi:hypothetical protein
LAGIVSGDEEEWMSSIKPVELGAVNCINGDAIAVHFAFQTQRKKVDKLNILARYGAFAVETVGVDGGGGGKRLLHKQLSLRCAKLRSEKRKYWQSRAF